MKTILFILLLSILPLAARDITVQWDPNPAEEEVTGYRLEVAQLDPLDGAGPGPWVAVGTTTATELQAPGLPNKTVYFRVFAINAVGESDTSEIIEVTPDRPGAPKGLKVKMVVKLTVEKTP